MSVILSLSLFEQITMLQNYEGRRLNLGMPEQFVLLLADIPNFEILIQGHLTKVEYSSTLQKLKSSLDIMVTMCNKIIENESLREFMQLLLCAGNFLNYVSKSK